MQDLVAEINRALRRRGWSAREASMRAVGSPELVRDMRRGYVTSVERFRALCEVLDLEFYVGQRREEVPVDEDRLAVALETAHEGLEGGGGAAAHARLVIAVYSVLGRGGRVPNAEQVRELIRAARGGGEGGPGVDS